MSGEIEGEIEGEISTRAGDLGDDVRESGNVSDGGVQRGQS